jgi:hypothetical protein
VREHALDRVREVDLVPGVRDHPEPGQSAFGRTTGSGRWPAVARSSGRPGASTPCSS